MPVTVFQATLPDVAISTRLDIRCTYFSASPFITAVFRHVRSHHFDLLTIRFLPFVHSDDSGVKSQRYTLRFSALWPT